MIGQTWLHPPRPSCFVHIWIQGQDKKPACCRCFIRGMSCECYTIIGDSSQLAIQFSGNYTFLTLQIVKSLPDVILKGYLSQEFDLCATCRRLHHLAWLKGKTKQFVVDSTSGKWKLLKRTRRLTGKNKQNKQNK